MTGFVFGTLWVFLCGLGAGYYLRAYLDRVDQLRLSNRADELLRQARDDFKTTL